MSQCEGKLCSGSEKGLKTVLAVQSIPQCFEEMRSGAEGAQGNEAGGEEGVQVGLGEPLRSLHRCWQQSSLQERFLRSVDVHELL